jgi:acetylornithine aminotransferase
MAGLVLKCNASELLPGLKEKGLIALSAGEKVLRLLPPLIVSKEEIDTAIKIIDQVLADHSNN